ncbi:aminodeoxychorismate synthase component I [Variovorax sp. ZT4R33]|uniref:aminodeoxychorismate synthase component I n=1 Tax=Variovorax sp. ZT4R33 TaxID=3443743 RepID=UPI003F459497
MRTLLIDNHDSFTYNLYQYLAAVNDEEPLVVRNDEMPWGAVEKLGFDNIVISPGPGRPQRPADLGISADALRHASVPVLGVCLGHQAMAHACGATVDLAVRPMHGRLDKISHAQKDIFRGIPDLFEAVRYHSLAVTQLPTSLEALAWTSDGTLMALRHVARPWWGVQFHPESVCTEFGARLLRNFRDLTQEWRSAPVRRSAPSSNAAHAIPTGDGRLHVHVEWLDTVASAEDMYVAAFSASPTSFWLDSSLTDSRRARFSFIGDASGPRAEIASYDAHDRHLEILRGDTSEVRAESVFDYLQAQLALPRPVAPLLPFDFHGGFVGYFGYESMSIPLAQQPLSDCMPDAAWIKVDRFIAFDHAEQVTWVVCLDTQHVSETNREWMRRMRERLAIRSTPPPSSAAPRPPASGLGALAWRTSLSSYRDLIVEAQAQILQGETYEVCLTNQLQAAGLIEPLGVYRMLRQRNPAPYAAFLKLGDRAVLCASPELFLRIGQDRSVESKPIKGTAARGATPAEDEAVATELARDEKTRAENLMIVDLLRNDLNRVCEVNSVHVPSLFSVETYATVHQLVSTIRGRLRADRTVIDCVRAAFPGGSMTGAPKERTMHILESLEDGRRGVYAGSLGYLSLDGAAQLNIVIRTIISTPSGISIGAGGAIVSMSDPDAEVSEIVLKTRALADVLEACGATATEPLPSAQIPSSDSAAGTPKDAEASGG